VRSRRRRLRAILLLVVAAIAVGGGLLAYATSALEQPENDSVDVRFKIKGKESPPKDVAVIGIDDKTFDELNVQFPFSRRLHARAIDRLKADGAKVIVYDVQFTEPSKNEDDDLALFDATQKAGNVVLATTEVDAKGGTDIFGGDDLVREARARAGNGNFKADADGVFRRVAYQLNKLKTLAVVGAERAGANPDPDRFGDKGAWIDYAGPPGTVPTYSFVDLLKGRVPPEKVRGRVVVVGVTAPVEQDVHATTAGGGLMPGAEIQANAIKTVLDDEPVRDLAGWAQVLLIALMGLVTPLSALRFRGLRPLIEAGVALVVYLAAVVIAFDAKIFPIADPLLAWVLGTVGTVVVYAVTELRERRRLRNEFARFVPAAVVDEVVERADDDLRLGGVRVRCTVMFCDLRGFTSWAEAQPAERVIEVLNRYLTEMSDAILDEGGTVVSYMGDGIMAVFGAPIEQPDHADRGLRAARAMLGDCLPRFNAWLAEQELGAGFRMGIGLNTGPVMSGNVGSERRLEYAAVGDTTNTASRIESLTKDTPHQLLVADSTHEALADGDGLVEAGEFTIRGREQAVRMWALGPATPA
jgi:adenylate cyclase